MNPKKALITVVLICFFALSSIPNTAAQDQVEIPRGRLVGRQIWMECMNYHFQDKRT